MGHVWKIDSEDDVVLVRRHARELAERLGFDVFAVAALTTAVSELARNVLVHAGRGTAVIEEVRSGSRVGIRAVFRDEGPGIPDVEKALAGGHSSARSLGLGLSGSRRLVDELTIDSVVGRGTVVTIVKWRKT